MFEYDILFLNNIYVFIEKIEWMGLRIVFCW